MNIIHHNAYPLDYDQPNIYLAGCFPNLDLKNKITNSLYFAGFTGNLFIPNDDIVSSEVNPYINWDKSMMKESDIIIYWISENIEKLSLKQFEMWKWLSTDKRLFYGHSSKVNDNFTAIDVIYEHIYKKKLYHNIDDMIGDIMQQITIY